MSRAPDDVRFHFVLWAKSVTNVYGRALLLTMLLTSLGCATSATGPGPAPGDLGTRPRGAPTIVHGIAIGTTSSGGPNCYDAYANLEASYDDGCGTIYAADARGTVRAIRAFSDPTAKHSDGSLIDGGDGWLYGKADPTEYLHAGPVVFRVTADGSKYQVVHRFRLSDNIASLGQLSLGPDRKLYAMATTGSTTLSAGAALLRIDGATYATLSTFDGLYGFVGPIVSKDGSITSLVTDSSLCVSILFRRDRSGVVHRLYERDPKFVNGCPSGDAPGPSLAAEGDAIVSLNAHAVVRIAKDGTRRIVAHLPTKLGTFIGPPLLAGNDIAALTISGYGNACSRLVRIDGKQTRVVHAFARAEGRCLNASSLYPHLARDRSDFLVTTTDGDHCADATLDFRFSPADRSCGALVRVRGDGTVAYVHDFVARKRVSDGGSPLTHAIASVHGRMLTISFARSPHASAPYVLDSAKVALTLRSSTGIATVVRATSNSAVSTRRSVTRFSVGYTDADVASVDFALPSTLPADMYAFSFDASDAIHDSLDEPIATESHSYTDSLYLPAPGNGGLEAMRARFVGRDVFGVGGVSGLCPDGNTVKTFAATEPLRVVSITRPVGTIADRDYYEENGAIAGRYFFRVEPLEVVLSTDRAKSGTTVAGSYDDPCPQIRFIVADSWELDRRVSLRPPIDPTWPRVDRDAVRNGVPILGMTRAMVVAIWGYPSVYGTINEIDRLNHWNYLQAAPFGHWVDFRGGRVVSVRPPGDLP